MCRYEPDKSREYSQTGRIILIKVYVAGNYSADNVIDVLKNIARGQKVAATLFEDGFAPFCPWWDRSFVLDNPEGTYTKEMFYRASIEWLKVSDVMLVISGDGNDGGVDDEIKIAEEMGIPVFYNEDDLYGLEP